MEKFEKGIWEKDFEEDSIYSQRRRKFNLEMGIKR